LNERAAAELRESIVIYCTGRDRASAGVTAR
jgi:hypothetical protein